MFVRFQRRFNTDWFYFDLAGSMTVSLQEKRVLALEFFGSNLVLDGKKARGSCVNPWSLLVENSPCGGMVRGGGFEAPIRNHP
jgi:hypothetical protein